MDKGRLEAFSDGVIAILITIMVLELKVPHGTTLEALRPLVPVMLGYVLSFVYLGIYWNNHHHMLQAAERVNGPILWANLHLLFWLSLVPFATTWVGEHPYDAFPTAFYGILLFMAGVAYWVLQNLLTRLHGKGSVLDRAFGIDFKGKASPILYAMGIAGSFVRPWIGQAFYVFVALMWLIPDRRIERQMGIEG